jgi:hypothetical protein
MTLELATVPDPGREPHPWRWKLSCGQGHEWVPMPGTVVTFRVDG